MNRQQLLQTQSCLTKAEDDEPLFVLRAKDPIAPIVVRVWAALSAALHAHEAAKIASANDLAAEMTVWRGRIYGNPRIDWGD